VPTSQLEFDGNRGYVALRKNIIFRIISQWVNEENAKIEEENRKTKIN